MIEETLSEHQREVFDAVLEEEFSTSGGPELKTFTIPRLVDYIDNWESNHARFFSALNTLKADKAQALALSSNDEMTASPAFVTGLRAPVNKRPRTDTDSMPKKQNTPKKGDPPSPKKEKSGKTPASTSNPQKKAVFGKYGETRNRLRSVYINVPNNATDDLDKDKIQTCARCLRTGHGAAYTGPLCNKLYEDR